MSNMNKPHAPYPRKRVLLDIYRKRPFVFGFSISHMGLEISIGHLGIGVLALRIDFDKMKTVKITERI